MKIIAKCASVAISLFVVSLGSGLRADTLLGFDLTGLTGTDTSVSSTTEATGVNSSSLTRGAGAQAGTTAFANTDIFNTNGNGNSSFTSSSLSAAISANQYYQWTFSATSTASLSSLNYSVYAQNNGSNPQNFSGDIQYSLNGFATAGIDLGGFSGVTPQSGANNYLGNAESTNLSSISALQNITSGETVTFRFYGFDGAAFTDQGFGRAGANDLVINGTVTVPEPSTVALMFCSGLGLWIVSRFRKAIS